MPLNQAPFPRHPAGALNILAALDTARAAGLPLPEARSLLASVTGMSRTALITHDDSALTQEQESRFTDLVKQRLAGMPMAYLLGTREFFGRDFVVTSDVLIPRPETELLVDFAIEHAAPDATMLDLGCGSGAIAVSVAAERPDVKVWAGDVSSAALAIAQQNNARLAHGSVQLRAGSWFAAFSVMRFDVVVSNPPYIAARDPHLAQGDVRFEPAVALSDHDFDAASLDGLSCIRHIVANAGRHLRSGGWLALEHGYDQAAAVRQLMSAAGFVEVHSRNDMAGIERITAGKWLVLRS
jgi:release factor glutamine methyltransferase